VRYRNLNQDTEPLTLALWIRDPLAILADSAERGFVVEDGRIIELVPNGRAPTTPDVAIFDASAHVVIPGLINTHHHFYQTLTRALPAALDRALFPWLQALYPIWARLTPEALDLITMFFPRVSTMPSILKLLPRDGSAFALSSPAVR
jgi:cytosine/adenosine deaminase-related metal-dependent hydrolase